MFDHRRNNRDRLAPKRPTAHTGWVRGKDGHHPETAATTRRSSAEPRFGREVQGETLLCLSRWNWKSGLCRPAETVQHLQATVAGPAGADGSGEFCPNHPTHVYRRNSRTTPHCDKRIRRLRAFRNEHSRLLRYETNAETLMIDNEPASQNCVARGTGQ